MKGNMSKTVVIHNSGVINNENGSNINDSSSGKRWGKRELSPRIQILSALTCQ